LEALVERASGLLDATGGELGLYEQAEGEIRIVVSQGLGKDHVGTRHGFGEGAMGRVIETGEPLIIEDYHAWEGRSPDYTDMPVHAVLAAPLEVGGRLVGVISVATTESARKFGPADLHLLHLFAQQAAIALENARLFDQAQREIAERIRAEARLREHQEHLEELVQERTFKLRESEERYRSLFDGVPVGLYRTTPAGEILDANLAFVQMAGHPSRESLLATNAASLYADPSERSEWSELMEKEGVVSYFESQLLRYDGTVIWASDAARAVRDESGKVLYYEGSFEDITERKRAAAELRQYQEHLEELVEARTAELRESEERYRTLFDGVPVGLYRTTPEGRILDANSAFAQIMGFANREDLLAVDDTATFYVDPEDQVRWRELMDRDGVVRDFETQVYMVDGTVRWGSDSARAVRDEQGQVLYYEGSVEDVTERKQFEQEIQRQKEYFEALFVNSPVAVLTANPNAEVVSWNPAAEKLFGYTQEETIGQKVDSLVANDPTLRKEADDYTRQTFLTGRLQAAARRTRKDGSLVDVEILAVPVVSSGEQSGFIAVYYDITELLEARRAAEAANQAKSAFLANMSHELRTPLNAILGFTQLMDGDANLTGEQQENLGIINRSGEHLLALINDVLEMSKIEAGRVTLQETSFDLDRMLGSLEEMFALRAARKDLSLNFEQAEGVPHYVQADESKLRQVLVNLLGNAIKFTEEGEVTLRVNQPRTAFLHFEIQDSGPGMTASELAVAFDPFVQAASGQQSQEGTGLGLSISRRYVQLLGGELTAESEPGRGCLFQFDVKVQLVQEVDVQPERPARRVLGLEPDQPTYRLLVVEDQAANRQLLVKLLNPLGFEVREAVNGQEAVQLCESWEPHLIWMDMRMPVMDGLEATRRIKAAALGQVPVIIALTATAFEEDRERVLLEGCDDFVRKPFHKDDIYDMLVKHLAVRFVYEDAAEEAPEAAAQAPEVLTPASLAALPAGWAAALHQATIRADLDRILTLVGEIRDHSPSLADALENLARNFEYQPIVSWVEQAGDSQEG
jgi:PAS domain S-box-containing protein